MVPPVLSPSLALLLFVFVPASLVLLLFAFSRTYLERLGSMPLAVVETHAVPVEQVHVIRHHLDSSFVSPCCCSVLAVGLGPSLGIPVCLLCSSPCDCSFI